MGVKVPTQRKIILVIIYPKNKFNNILTRYKNQN